MIIQLTRTRAVWRDDPQHALPRLRDEFRERHCVRLPALIEPALLTSIQREMDRAEFSVRAHHAIATELTMKANTCTGLLQFLVNDRHLYRLVEEVAEHGPIRAFMGRVYRVEPERQHTCAWHNDLIDDRRAGLSINLGATPYDGGVFEIRDADTEQVLASIANVGPGDAFLFRLAPTLEHRVTDVVGSVPKTAFAGWFRADPDYLATCVAPGVAPDGK